MPLRRRALPRHDAGAATPRRPVNGDDDRARDAMPAAPLLDWQPAALERSLAAHLPGLRVQVLGSVDSTNTRLLERFRTPATAPRDATLLVAEQQTQGRGRQGRAWFSTRGASLTFSLAWPLRIADWSGLSLAVGVALADALDRGDAPRIVLKWPNDLWLLDGPGSGRKLGGILIETQGGGAPPVAVIGVGLNVLPFAPHDARSGFACLHDIDAGATAPDVLHRVALPLVLALQRFERGGFAAFESRYRARDLLLGRDVQAGALHGRAEGVAADGALRVRDRHTVHRIVGGEVSVRLRAAADASLPPTPC
jgi:BirA family transcriptional regulator, biotin operon repressor / biotin---[acetyl-CoA-carboxylase] ligase